MEEVAFFTFRLLFTLNTFHVHGLSHYLTYIEFEVDDFFIEVDKETGVREDVSEENSTRLIEEERDEELKSRHESQMRSERNAASKAKAKERDSARKQRIADEAKERARAKAEREAAERAEAAEAAIRAAIDLATEKWKSGDRADAKKRLQVAATKHAPHAREPVRTLLKSTKDRLAAEEASERRLRSRPEPAPEQKGTEGKGRGGRNEGRTGSGKETEAGAAASFAEASSSSDARAGKDDESSQCIVCMDAPRTHACVPCGHRNMCVKCTSEVNLRCPECRADVSCFVRIYG